MTILIKNSKVSPLQSIFLLVLHNSSPLSGAEIVKRLEEEVGTEWVPTPGARYKILQFLEENAYIEKIVEKGDDPNDKRVSKYALTQEGEKMVTELNKQMKKVFLFLTNCCADHMDDIKIVKINKGEKC